VRDIISNEIIASSALNSAFEVPAGSYVFSFDVPKGIDPRDTYRLAFPIEAIKHQILQIAAFPPAVEDLQDFTPVVVGDSHLGLGTTIIRTIGSEHMGQELRSGGEQEHPRQKLRIKVRVDDIGWVLVPFPENISINKILKLQKGVTK